MFFTRDKEFYKSFFHLLCVVALQNVVAYSVNMADNLMLGAYSQDALSGAATVNMIQFMLQQLTIGGFTNGLVALASQYWGKGETEPIRKLTGIALKFGMVTGFILLAVTTIFPRQILSLFTADGAFLDAGVEYLSILKFTYLFYIMTTILLGALRSVATVNIAFVVSVISLVVNVGINYTLIFGHFGAPRLGITGAAIGTLTARVLEFLIVVGYLLFADQKLQLFKGKKGNPFQFLLAKEVELRKDYIAYTKTVAVNSIVWAMATPVQTAILGHMSKDAIAANSVATTMYQYLKVIVVGEASATAVSIGNLLGKGVSTKELLKPYIHAVQVIFLSIGLALGLVLYLIRQPLLSFYTLSEGALALADSLLVMMVIIFIGMAYQMPLGSGVIQGGGDAKYSMHVNMISTWGIVIPLSLVGAFVLKLSPFWVVLILNSDQVFKCLPIGIRVNSYKWMRILTR